MHKAAAESGVPGLSFTPFMFFMVRLYLLIFVLFVVKVYLTVSFGCGYAALCYFAYFVDNNAWISSVSFSVFRG